MESLSPLLPRRAHLVGIAGSGMRALADVLLGLGWQLSGSDLEAAAVEKIPRSVRCFVGHSVEHIPAGTQELIHSEAVPADNPELCGARQLGLPTFSYAQMLGRLGRGRQTVAVAGTHGKSTTTAMLGHLLGEAGRDPMIVCGATPLGQTSGGRAGGETLLVEACEFRHNFLHLDPQQAAILGIELDHVDCYPELPRLEDAFRQFAGRLPEDGFLLARHGCPSSQRILAATGRRGETFGQNWAADWTASELTDEGGCFRFVIQYRGKLLGKVRLRAPGRHNVLNALAAAALAWHNGLSAVEIVRGLGSFAGLHRRMERLPAWRGVERVDDYAHHPTEIAHSLETVRRLFPHNRVWCVFQPHQASRTGHFFASLAASLRNVDKLLVAEIFRAREGAPRPGEITAADLARCAVGLGVDAIPGHTDEEIRQVLATQLAPGDVLVTLGAGDVAKFQPGEQQ